MKSGSPLTLSTALAGRDARDMIFRVRNEPLLTPRKRITVMLLFTISLFIGGHT